MAEFASKGVAGTGLGLGIAGTALGVLAGGLNNIGGIYGGTARTAGVCSEDHCVNRYELAQESKIAALEADKKLLESTIYTNSQMNDVRNYVDTRFAGVEARLNAQDVYNATNTSAIGCINSQIANLQALVGGITKTVVPITAVCPEPMKLYNSWTAPTTTA
jgi:hypothetical protein